MTLSLDDCPSLYDVRPVVMRDLLRAVRRNGAVKHDYARLRSVELDIARTVLLQEEFADLGFLTFRDDENPFRGLSGSDRQVATLTKTGSAFVKASGLKRFSRRQGREILESLLANAEAMASDETAAYIVDEIWLFGSMLGSSEMLGDVDVAVSLICNPRLLRTLGPDSFFDYATCEAREHLPASTFATFFGYYGAPRILALRRLQGGRKIPQVSIAEVDELSALGCPCRLVFSHARGGRVSDPDLGCHPSAERAVEPVRTLPEWKTDLRPGLVSARTLGHRMSRIDFDEDLADVLGIANAAARLPFMLVEILQTPITVPASAQRGVLSRPCADADGVARLATYVEMEVPRGRRTALEAVRLDVSRSLSCAGSSTRVRVDLVLSSSAAACDSHLAVMALLPILVLMRADAMRQSRAARRRGEDERVSLEINLRGFVGDVLLEACERAVMSIGRTEPALTITLREVGRLAA